MKIKYIKQNNSKLLITLIFLAAMSALSISPAFADRDDDHGWGGDRGYDRGHQEWHGDDDRDRGGYGYANRGGYGYGNRGGYGYGGYYQPPRY